MQSSFTQPLRWPYQRKTDLETNPDSRHNKADVPPLIITESVLKGVRTHEILVISTLSPCMTST